MLVLAAPQPDERLWDGCRRVRYLRGLLSASEKSCGAALPPENGHGIPYAIIDARALNEFGHRRVTVDVEVLLTPGFSWLNAATRGSGCVEQFPGSRRLRDRQFGVDIGVVLAGWYPGDGHAKPVALPDPSAAERGAPGCARGAAAVVAAWSRRSWHPGITVSHRLKDLADVLELVRHLGLGPDFADALDPRVREKYLELWRAAQGSDPA